MWFSSSQKIFAIKSGDKEKGFVELVNNNNGKKTKEFKKLNSKDIEDILSSPSKSTPLIKRLTRLNKRLHKRKSRKIK